MKHVHVFNRTWINQSKSLLLLDLLLTYTGLFKRNGSTKFHCFDKILQYFEVCLLCFSFYLGWCCPTSIKASWKVHFYLPPPPKKKALKFKIWCSKQKKNFQNLQTKGILFYRKKCKICSSKSVQNFTDWQKRYVRVNKKSANKVFMWPWYSSVFHRLRFLNIFPKI